MGFDRAAPDGRPAPTGLLVVTMTEYESGLPVEVAFPPEEAVSLAQAFSEAGWRQFHVAETEKYAHVTYFFNGGVEPPYPGEERRLDPEPQGRDLRPRAGDERGRRHRRPRRGDRVRPRTTSSWRTSPTPTWSVTPGSGTRRSPALEVVDGCLARIVGAIEGVDADDPDAPGALLAITADHGNADELRDADGHPVTAHSLNPVPLVLVGRAARGLTLADGVLADVAPTLLQFAGLPRWDGMTGRSRIL